MTVPEIRALLHEIDQCCALIEDAGHHIADEKPAAALAQLDKVAEGVERLRHALDDSRCCAAIVLEIQRRPEFKRTQRERA